MKKKIKNISVYPRRRAGIDFDVDEEKEVDLDKDEFSQFEDRYFKIEDIKSEKKSAKPTVTSKTKEAEEKSEEFVCDECEKSFGTEKGLKLHKTKTHGGD